MRIDEITVHDLQKGLKDKSLLLLDVRTPEEYEVSHLECTHIPLNELQTRAEELDRDMPMAVICRSGGRSAKATDFLDQLGFDVVNVQGGMNAWKTEIDPSLTVA